MRNRVNWRDQPKIKDFRHFSKVNGKITPSIGDHFFGKYDMVVYESFYKDGKRRYKEIMILENTIFSKHDIEYLYRLRYDEDGYSFVGPNDLPQEDRWRNWFNRGVVREPYRNELRSFFYHLHRSIIKEDAHAHLIFNRLKINARTRTRKAGRPFARLGAGRARDRGCGHGKPCARARLWLIEPTFFNHQTRNDND